MYMSVLSGPSDLSSLCLRGGVWIEKRNRQEIRDRVGRALSKYCDQPLVYYSKFLYTPTKKGGIGKKTSFPIIQETNRHNYFINYQTSSNHTLDQYSVIWP